MIILGFTGTGLNFHDDNCDHDADVKVLARISCFMVYVYVEREVIHVRKHRRGVGVKFHAL